ncbi:glycosyltransferase family 4 protein [Sphingomonas sinipercae]|uniref:Glycosyltransferase family 4 protein n=1 Tax=Sphingomonas sinipercae TaxID=2714944 RepID=A0A6G7ZKL4_9SPHN|nr:glycosyltransferase [Sphingomonas sinipercae]QIL01450.1 glycosyltransferase family 4 protein [Sphingomonas sinipercae]
MADGIFARAKPSADFRNRTVMVVMPHGWKGGFFRVAAALCNAINALDVDGIRFRVILGVPAGYDCTERYLLDPEVVVEQIGYDLVDPGDRRYVSAEAAQFLGDLPLVTPARTLPYGDTGTIGEVDAYILLSALFLGGVFVSRKPFAVYIADMIQRYVPEIYSDQGSDYSVPPWKMDRHQRASVKLANCVFSTTEQTRNDVLHYGGVAPDRTMLFPMFAMDVAEQQERDAGRANRSAFQVRDLVSQSQVTVEPGKYFLWVTNAAAHKNHVNALRALRHYYEGLGGELTCLMCGPVTDMLIPKKPVIQVGDKKKKKGKKKTSDVLPYHQRVFKEVENWTDYNRHIKVLGYTSDQAYLSLLRDAKFLWHNVIYDNGTFSIIEASSVGTPVASSDYPQIRFIDKSFGVGSTFFDAHDPVDAANKLRWMEQNAKPTKPRRVGTINRADFETHLAELMRRLFTDGAGAVAAE